MSAEAQAIQGQHLPLSDLGPLHLRPACLLAAEHIAGYHHHRCLKRWSGLSRSADSNCSSSQSLMADLNYHTSSPSTRRSMLPKLGLTCTRATPPLELSPPKTLSTRPQGQPPASLVSTAQGGPQCLQEACGLSGEGQDSG